MGIIMRVTHDRGEVTVYVACPSIDDIAMTINVRHDVSLDDEWSVPISGTTRCISVM